MPVCCSGVRVTCFRLTKIFKKPLDIKSRAWLPSYTHLSYRHVRSDVTRSPSQLSALYFANRFMNRNFAEQAAPNTEVTNITTDCRTIVSTYRWYSLYSLLQALIIKVFRFTILNISPVSRPFNTLEGSAM